MLRTYKDFSIYYHLKTISSYQQLIELLENNYDFFKTILPNKISFSGRYVNHYPIKDLDTFILKKVREMKNEKWVKDYKKNPSKLSKLFLEYLLHTYDKEDYFNKSDHDRLYDLSLATFVYYDKEEDILKSLKNIKEEQSNIWNYLLLYGEEYAMNQMLKVTDDTIHSIYPNLFNDLEPFWEELKEYPKEEEEMSYKLTSITEKELISLTDSFLEEVDPSMEWKTFFHKIIEEDRLVLIDNENNELRNRSNADNGKITLYRNYNVNDFNVLVHELIHLIAEKSKIDNMSYLLAEFLPIFYEYLAIDYLEERGLDNDEIIAMYYIRNRFIDSITPMMMDLLSLIKEKEEKGFVKRERMMEILKESHPDKNQEEIEDLLYLYLVQLAGTGTSIITRVSYVTGRKAARMYHGTDLDTMKEITENIFSLDISSIFNPEEKKVLKKK